MAEGLGLMVVGFRSRIQYVQNHVQGFVGMSVMKEIEKKKELDLECERQLFQVQGLKV